mmetsp:Transcript_1444/g.2947  ORF Transcript_1444/g.2947 Transcript_1444/m.2947 type:complete len:323 (+) Transcript_1444:44-1012(+)
MSDRGFTLVPRGFRYTAHPCFKNYAPPKWKKAEQVRTAETPYATWKGHSPASEVIADECAVCLARFHDPVILIQCKHSFCFECISLWCEKANTCPLCKSAHTEFLRYSDTNPNTNAIENTNANTQLEAVLSDVGSSGGGVGSSVGSGINVGSRHLSGQAPTEQSGTAYSVGSTACVGIEIVDVDEDVVAGEGGQRGDTHTTTTTHTSGYHIWKFVPTSTSTTPTTVSTSTNAYSLEHPSVQQAMQVHRERFLVPLAALPVGKVEREGQGGADLSEDKDRGRDKDRERDRDRDRIRGKDRDRDRDKDRSRDRDRDRDRDGDRD